MKFSPQIFRPLLGILFGTILFLTSFFGNSVITLILPIVYLNRHRQWRLLIDRAISFWIIIPVVSFLFLLNHFSFYSFILIHY